MNERCAPSFGPLDAKIAIVSRSPAKGDVIRKRPFAGASGKILDYLLNQQGVQRQDVLTTNVVLCRSDAPPNAAIAACRPRLTAELENVETIIAAGTEAVTELTRFNSMEGARGYAHKRRSGNGRTQRIIATNNPALVMRDDSAFPNLVRDFRLAINPLPPPELPQVEWTNNVEEAKKWLTRINEQALTNLTVDIETKGLRADAQIVAIGVSSNGKRAVSFGNRVCDDKTTFRDYIRPLISARETGYLYHNGKFDVRNLRDKGVGARVDEDTMLLSWALDERSDEGQVHRLEYLLMNELNWPNYEPHEVRKFKADVARLEKQLKFDELRELAVPDELYKYNALDAAGTTQLFPILKERAIADNVWERPYKSLLLPASEALVKVELVGIGYDADRACDMLEEEVWPRLTEYRAELGTIVGDGKYNPNSSTQNSKLVYDEWEVIHTLPLKNERSVDKSVYTEIKEGRFMIGSLDDRMTTPDKVKRTKETAVRWATTFADFKGLDKQRSTYIEGLVPVAMYNGNRLYTDFKLHNTVSGRTTSSRPNLQNITRTKPGLPDIRSLFVASPGKVLVSADYSQAELRAIAYDSGDTGLSDIFHNGQDLHDITARRFFGENFTKENRQTCKNMNFGVPYLQTAATFQQKHGIPEDQAQQFIDWWFTEFPGVLDWHKRVTKDVLGGEVIGPFGNKRRFHLITKENRNASIREGINFIPQSAAAYLTIYSLIQLAENLDFTRSPIILTVHDSIIIDCEPDLVSDVSTLLRNIMVAAPIEALGWDYIPFDVDISVGPNWSHLEELELVA